MNRHAEQMTSVLSRAVQEVLSRGLSDPRVRGLVSVTGLELSKDYMYATVLVSVFPEEHAALTMHGLRHATPHIRSAVGKRVTMRRLPQLAFRLDDSLKKQASVLAVLQDAVPASDGADDAGAAGTTGDNTGQDENSRTEQENNREERG